MKRTPRVVIPPHTEMQKSAVRREKNSLKVSRRNISFLCRRWKIPLRKPLFPIGAEVSFYGSFYHLPQQGSRRNPAKRFRWEEDERQRERVLPLAAGRGIRRPLGRRPASRLSGLRRSRCPAKCTGRGMAPHPQAAGRSPHPLKAASVSAETLLPASGGAASKGGPVPL